jgi:hypothetical protein
MLNFTRLRASSALLLCASALTLPTLVVPPASAAEISPELASCARKAIGAAAAGLMSGSEKALSKLTPAQRGLIQGCLLTNGRPLGKSSKLPPRLTVSPMDPTLVTYMSKFRSCAGHDFSGLNISGKAESNRSMKHYVYVNKPWTATGSIPVVAPFSGTAIVSVEPDYPLGSWVRILNRSGWAFTAFHVDPSISDGQKVTAGQQIGTFPPANAPTFMPERMNEPEANFDFTLQSTDGRNASFLDWMTPSAQQAWAARGFAPKTMTISEKERNAKRCAASFPDGPGSTGFVSAGSPG